MNRSKTRKAVCQLCLVFGCWLSGVGCWVLTAQGLLFDDAGYEQEPRWPELNNGAKAEYDLLKGLSKKDLKPFCPKPNHQGFIASCTGWSSGYGALSMHYAMQKGWAGKTDSITRHAFSALYIYNQIKKGSCEFGAYITDAMQVLKDQGDVPSAAFDFMKNDCSKAPDQPVRQQAYPYRIQDYTTLFSSNASRQDKIQKTKLCLAQNSPVVIGMTLRQNFSAIGSVDPVWRPTKGDTSLMGGHAMVVIGFDDGMEAFEVLNSWGTSWGKGGFGWVKYDDYATYCRYGYQIIPLHGGSNQKQVQTSLALSLPQYTETGELVLTTDVLAKKNGIFCTPELPKGSIRQLNLNQNAAGQYVYVFSLAPDRSIRVHWPRDEDLDAQFTGKHETALIPLPNAQIAIPGSESALQFNQSGLEHLVVLLASEPVNNLNEMLKQWPVRPAPEGIVKDLYKAFGTKLVPWKDISTQESGYKGSVSTGKIIPMVMQIKVK